MSKIRSITLNVEGKSSEHLKKLLELALFDLQETEKSTGFKTAGDCLPVNMSGDMGSYTLEYKLGSHALITAQAELVAQGYQKTDVSDKCVEENYAVFVHDDKPPVRLYFESVQIGEHDIEDHAKNGTDF